MRRFLRILLITLLGAGLPMIAAADVRVMVSRNTDVTVVYLRAPLAHAQGTVLDGLVPPEGIETTMGDAREMARAALDDLAQTLILTADGVSVPLAAQSGVYHRTADGLSFDTPFDASVASVVCATPEAALPDADELTIYGAWIAPVPLSTADLTLVWPDTAATPVDATLRVFQRSRLRSEGAITLSDATSVDLSLPPMSPRGVLSITLAAFGGVMLLLAALFWIHRPRDAAPDQT